ncbi:methylamine utilization protein [Marinimicrobium sp. C2-29]|uniref:methylamine utilization protein n=1 Tax=Marinimicrobium sp. C2-29 TaxID=3139825 RepID=UPI003138CC1B
MFPIKAGLCALGLLLPALSLAAELTVEVRGPEGQALEHAVAALLSEADDSDRPEAVMDQRDRQFAPYVLAVRTNTLVRFPNSDDIRHHVYSFSPAKRFELRLYHGSTAEPVLFDQAGKVSLGCNIHDAMLGYIYVVDSQWYDVSDSDGRAVLADIPAGDYDLQIQHPRLAEPLVQRISLAADDTLNETIELEALGPDPRAREPESDLQRLFDR